MYYDVVVGVFVGLCVDEMCECEVQFQVGGEGFVVVGGVEQLDLW